MKKFYLIIILAINCMPILSQDINNLVNKDDKIPLNEDVELVKMFISNSFDTISICNNNDALKIFENRINFLKCYIKTKHELPFGKVIRIILNFELLTNIESESDANFIGKYNPTEKDIEKWTSWFEDNKEKICWYKEKDILFKKK